MALDPRRIPFTAEQRTSERVADLERRVAAAERTPRIQYGEGPPSLAVRSATAYLDTLNNKLYLRVGAAWKSAALS